MLREAILKIRYLPQAKNYKVTVDIVRSPLSVGRVQLDDASMKWPNLRISHT